MNGCRRALDDLTRLAAGTCPPEREAGLRAHLDRCASCRREKERLFAALDWLATEYPGDDGIDWEALPARIRQTARQAPPERMPDRPGRVVLFPIPRAGWLGSRTVRIGAAAVGVMAFLLVVVLGVRSPGVNRGAGTGAAGTGMAASPSETDLLDTIDAIDAKWRAVSVLTEGRGLLDALVTPVACGSGGAGADGRVDVTLEAVSSRRLLDRAQLLEARLVGSEGERAAAVWRDLRDVLRDLGEMPACPTAEELLRLLESISRSELTTRLDVIVSELGGKTAAPAARGSERDA